MKMLTLLIFIFSIILINCGSSSHGTYMQNRSLDQQIADEEREKIVDKEQENRRVQGSVDQKMEDFNRKALEKNPESTEEGN